MFKKYLIRLSDNLNLSPCLSCRKYSGQCCTWFFYLHWDVWPWDLQICTFRWYTPYAVLPATTIDRTKRLVAISTMHVLKIEPTQKRIHGFPNGRLEPQKGVCWVFCNGSLYTGISEENGSHLWHGISFPPSRWKLNICLHIYNKYPFPKIDLTFENWRLEKFFLLGTQWRGILVGFFGHWIDFFWSLVWLSTLSPKSVVETPEFEDPWGGLFQWIWASDFTTKKTVEKPNPISVWVKSTPKNGQKIGLVNNCNLPRSMGFDVFFYCRFTI